MDSRSAEIAAEQDYFTNAAGHRARKLAGLTDVTGAAANAGAAAHLKRYADEAAQAIGRATDAVAFGRIDLDDTDVLYIGRHLIRDDNSEVLVVNWHANAAAAFFEASHAKPMGVVRKRTFDCDGNTVTDFADVLFADVAQTVDAFLLGVLGRGRTGAMQDIVATIQAAQYDVIRSPWNQVLVIEGGPGTGKTAVALHRVSWLLYHHATELRAGGILVVGPNPTFIRYIQGVLPSLGDTDVVMRDIARVGPDVRRGRQEPATVTELKGDVRMASFLARALESRIGQPETVERLPLDGRFLSMPGADIAALIAECRAKPVSYAQRRELFRDRLVETVQARAGGQIVRPGALANLVERLWPSYSPRPFLRDLLGSRRRLLANASNDDALSPAEERKNDLNAAEVGQLYRPGADRVDDEIWADADVPLLDELTHLIAGTEDRYRHIVVDEAQDLSPMQLRSLARRSANGSFTIVGDIAQSTGLWARDDWRDVTAHLPERQPVHLAPLRYGYRVPREAYDFAARLLGVAAPGVRPPEVVRHGPTPVVHQIHLDQRARRVVSVAADHAAAGRFVGIICPDRCRREVEAALATAAVSWSSAARGELGAINLVSPAEAKGLEFDAVVVVEPEHIVTENRRGLRMLYVALTRTTGHLDVVCVGQPLPLSVPETPPSPPRGPEHPVFSDRDVQRLAAHVAAQIRSASPPALWSDVVAAAKRLLDTSER